MESDASELERRVAENLLSRDLEAETWQKGVAINGLLSIGASADARRLVDRSIRTQTSSGYLSYGDYDPKESLPEDWPDYDSAQFQCGAATVGQSVLEFFERTGDRRYLTAAEKQYRALETAARTEGGGISYTDAVPELWVDSMYMVPPFLACYGRVTDDEGAVEAAIEQLLIHHDRLVAPEKGLYRHIWREVPDTYPESSLWSRGNGWAVAGLLDTLVHLDGEAGADRLEELFVEFCETVADYQDASGFWHHILDDPRSPLETSGTLMFAYAIARGIAEGILEEGEYPAVLRDAMEACAGVVDDDGRVTRVALPPGGPGVSLGVTTYGQGWYLLASTAVPDRHLP